MSIGPISLNDAFKNLQHIDKNINTLSFALSEK